MFFHKKQTIGGKNGKTQTYEQIKIPQEFLP